MICTVKEGRYHGWRVLCETFAVITIVINTKRKSKTARFDFWGAQTASCCQSVRLGSVPRRLVLNSAPGVQRCCRQAAGNYRLGAYAPRNTRCHAFRIVIVCKRPARKSVDHPPVESAVGIDAAVTQKWPMRPMLVYPDPFHIGDHNLFFVDGTFCNDLAVRSANKTLPPKFDSVPAGRRFLTDPIRRGDIAAIRDRMAALDRFPRGMLRCAEVFLFRWVPPDRCWIKNNLRAAQRCETCCLGVPLVPANADADLAVRCLPRLKSQVTGREVKFFVIKRVVRNVHLAIFA